MERGDDVASVEAVLAPLTQLVERLRLPQYRWYLELHRGCRALLDGDADLAEQAALTALEVGSGMGELNVELAFGASTYLQFLERDRTAELVELAAEQVERFPGLLAWRAVLAQTLAARGDRCTATKTLLLALEELPDAPTDPLRPVTLALLIDAAQRLADVHAADALHELRIARRAEIDRMREDRGACDIVVAVHGVRAPDQRDPRAGAHRSVPKCVSEIEPRSRRRAHVPARRGIAAVEDGAQAILAHVIGRHRADVGLDDLADLVLERKRRDDLFQARLERLIRRRPCGRGRP